MASIHREVVLETDPKDIWAAVRDVTAPHKRLAPEFLADTRPDDGARVVTFADDLVAHELIVDVDDEARRFVWAVNGSSRRTHYDASMQVLDAGEGRSRFVWIADLLPDAAAGDIGALIDRAIVVIKKTLERQ